MQHLTAQDIERQTSGNPEMIFDQLAPVSKIISPERQVRERAATIATDKLFDLLPPLDVGDPEKFLSAVAAILAEYPLRVMRDAIDPVKGVPSRAARPSLAFIRRVCDELHEPILREEEQKYAELNARRSRIPPRLPRTPEEQERVDQNVEDFRRQFGIPPGGLGSRSVALPISAEQRGTGHACESKNDGKHHLRVEADLAARRARRTGSEEVGSR